MAVVTACQNRQICGGRMVIARGHRPKRERPILSLLLRRNTEKKTSGEPAEAQEHAIVSRTEISTTILYQAMPVFRRVKTHSIWSGWLSRFSNKVVRRL